VIGKAKLASDLLGVGPGAGGLEKLAIWYWDGKHKRRKVEALFNPSEIALSRSVAYDAKQVARRGGLRDLRQEYLSVEPATLTVDLFFDTYESRAGPAAWKQKVTSGAVSLATPTNPFQSGDATDVRDLTDQIAQLAAVDPDLHRPPRCHLAWGQFDIFYGVLTNLDQTFTMFLNDGTPVRATLSCSFVEYRTTAHARAGELHSADVAKTRTVRRNDTLHGIAAEEYNDPALWRLIAKANGIVNPRSLAPGTALVIPKLHP
jgi:nucleoid-associated protein YgaU